MTDPTPKDQVRKGGCHCGRIRFRVTGSPLDSGYCHCRICQHLSGAPATAWAEFPIDAISFTGENPTVYHSSSWGERRFCPTCGGDIDYRDSNEPKSISLSILSFDDPEAIAPRCHIFVSSQVSWCHFDDGLPRHDASGEG